MNKRIICLVLTSIFLFVYIATPAYALDEQSDEIKVTLSLFSNKAPEKSKISGLYKDNNFYITFEDLEEISGATIEEETANSVVLSTNDQAREYEIFLDKQILVETNCEAQNITMPSIIKDQNKYVSALHFLRYIGADVEFDEKETQLNVYVQYNIFDALSDCVNNDLGNFFWWDEVDCGDESLKEKLINAGVVALINKESNIFKMMLDAEGIAQEYIEDNLISIVQNEGQNTLKDNDIEKLGALNDFYDVETDVAEFIVETYKSDATKELGKAIDGICSSTAFASSLAVNILKTAESLKQFDSISNAQMNLLESTILQHSKDSPLLCGEWDIVLDATSNINLRVKNAYANNLAESIKLIEEVGYDAVGLVAEAPIDPVSLAWEGAIATMKLVPYTSNIIDKKSQLYTGYNCSMIQCIAEELFIKPYCDLYYNDYLYTQPSSQLERLRQMKNSMILQYKSTLTTREALIASKYLSEDFAIDMQKMNQETAILLNKLENCKIVCVGLEPLVDEDLSWLANCDSMNVDTAGKYVHDKYLVEYNGVIYGVDENGLWKNKDGYQKDYLSKCSATNIATNGHKVYYGVFNKTVDYYPYSSTSPCEIYQYDMYEYDLDTGSNKKIIPFKECGEPICVIGNTIYYTDFPDDFDGDMVGRAQGLCSYNLSTGEKKYICDGAAMVHSYGDKIFYRDIMVTVPFGDSHYIYCYDTVKKQTKKISDSRVLNFKIISGKVYYDTLLEDYDNNKVLRTVKACCYDISSDTTEVLLEKSGESLRIEDYDEKYVVYSKDEGSFCLVDIVTGKEKEVLSSNFDGDVPHRVMRDSDCTIFYTDYSGGRVFTLKDGSTKMDSTNSSYIWQQLLTVVEEKAFMVTSDSKNFYEYNISSERLS